MFRKDFARLIKEAKSKIRTGSPKGSDLAGLINNEDDSREVQSCEGTRRQQMGEEQGTTNKERRGSNEANLPNEDLTDADLSRELMDMNEDGKDPPGND